MKVDGGASKNNLLLQIQSDLLQCNVIRPKITETTALGAAFLAGLSTGFFKDISSLKNIWKKDRSFEPVNDSYLEKVKLLWEKRMNQVLYGE